MEFVEGRSLDQIIKTSGPLEPGRSLAIMTQVLSALGFAHENAIVHRDVKPSNIMVLNNGEVKVADFGIARIDASEFTIIGDLLGTPAYMAPEQLTGGPVDHRTDLFAAGVILFEMLSGVKPFRGKSITEIMSFMQQRGPEDLRTLNPAVPAALRQVIARALAFDPAQRYGSAAEFSKALAEAFPAASGEPQTAAAPAAEAVAAAAETRLVAGGAPAPEEPSLHPELSREIERDLATFIGPMASITVRRAVRQTVDILELYEILGRQIGDPKERAQFLASGRQRAAARLGRPGAPAAVTTQSPRARTAQPAMPPSPASIVAIEADLTRYIGPIARILVKKELARFQSLAKLCLLLAAHIPDERERKAFLDAHGAE
jgi:serine/threonine-protein kinase